jgi:enterochelin esterase-like enzyme
MSARAQASRTHVWFEGLGEWSWPGRRPEAVDWAPPSWVPAFPPRLAPAMPAGALAGPPSRERLLSPAPGIRVLLATLASALLAAFAALALNGTLDLGRVMGSHARAGHIAAARARPLHLAAPLPPLVAVSHDRAGSLIDDVSYRSAALHRQGAFLVYLPPGYRVDGTRYPVLYLLHGNEQQAHAFLEMGLQRELDHLIAARVIPPLIAVMVHGGRGPNNWRNQGPQAYENYVLEVQALVDRMLPTRAERGSRAIAGDSMGGYGAMNIALGHLERFGVVESWLGFFNGLGKRLHADRPLLARIGLHAFVYGGESDRIADPSENAPFADALRAAGAGATGIVYAGGHSMETLEVHLPHMLAFAGRAMAAGAGR